MDLAAVGADAEMSQRSRSLVPIHVADRKACHRFHCADRAVAETIALTTIAERGRDKVLRER